MQTITWINVRSNILNVKKKKKKKKKSQTQKTNLVIVLIHLCEISRKDKFIETEGRSVVARGSV